MRGGGRIVSSHLQSHLQALTWRLSTQYGQTEKLTIFLDWGIRKNEKESWQALSGKTSGIIVKAESQTGSSQALDIYLTVLKP